MGESIFLVNGLEVRGPMALLRAALILILTAPVMMACEDRSALRSFNECIGGPIESVRRGAAVVHVACDLGDQLFLVGLPGRQVTVDELLAAGVTREVAESLSQSDLIGDKWCAVAVADSPASAQRDQLHDRVATTECETTPVEIPDVVQAHSAILLLTLVPSSSGSVRIAKVEKRARKK